MGRVLIATSEFEYDPSEVAIPWLALAKQGHEVVLATSSGQNRGADPIMLTGARLGILKGILAARKDATAAYGEISQTPTFQRPKTFQEVKESDFDLLILPGGHAPGIRPYIESPALQKIVGEFFRKDKLIGAICHGVLVAARAINPATNKSCLDGRSSTSLLKSQEISAWMLTRLWLGNYYRTYPGISVEEETRRALGSSGKFYPGPLPLGRDREDNLKSGFIVEDGNYLSARWPGDCHLFARHLIDRLS